MTLNRGTQQTTIPLVPLVRGTGSSKNSSVGSSTRIIREGMRRLWSPDVFRRCFGVSKACDRLDPPVGSEKGKAILPRKSTTVPVVGFSCRALKMPVSSPAGSI
jgi:hypothetical protein